jgi:hypothetical protein
VCTTWSSFGPTELTGADGASTFCFGVGGKSASFCFAGMGLSQAARFSADVSVAKNADIGCCLESLDDDMMSDAC